jgi:hypothetical protein
MHIPAVEMRARAVRMPGSAARRARAGTADEAATVR